MIERAFDAITELESPVQARILERLSTHPDVRVVGPIDPGVEARVSTVSFVHGSIPSEKISGHAHGLGVGIRHGHMYAHRLCERLGIPIEDGVVRISPVHYNTVQEVDHLFDGLDPLLGG